MDSDGLLGSVRMDPFPGGPDSGCSAHFPPVRGHVTACGQETLHQGPIGPQPKPLQYLKLFSDVCHFFAKWSMPPSPPVALRNPQHWSPGDWSPLAVTTEAEPHSRSARLHSPRPHRFRLKEHKDPICAPGPLSGRFQAISKQADSVGLFPAGLFCPNGSVLTYERI